MAIGIIARKIGMESVFLDNKLMPCTILETLDCTVTQIKTKATDGYDAIQIAGHEKKEKNTTQPLKGHFDKANTPPKKKIVEFKNFLQHQPAQSLQLGNTLTANDLFEEHEYIDAIGTSKGKGFCGVVKRHHFKGAKEATHGQKHTLRAPGSIGNVEEPVRKGKKMAGRTGRKTTKIKNLRILKIMHNHNIMLLKGPVPGPNKSYIILQK